MYLAIDPGDMTGMAVIGTSGELLWEKIFPYEELIDELQTLKWRTKLSNIIVEDFALLPTKAQAVSQTKSRHMKAARGIGVVEAFGAMYGVPVEFRDPRHWRVGLQLAGIPPKDWPKNHAKGHGIVAYGLGFHWLVENNLVEARLGS